MQVNLPGVDALPENLNKGKGARESKLDKEQNETTRS